MTVSEMFIYFFAYICVCMLICIALGAKSFKYFTNKLNTVLLAFEWQLDANYRTHNFILLKFSC